MQMWYEPLYWCPKMKKVKELANYTALAKRLCLIVQIEAYKSGTVVVKAATMSTVYKTVSFMPMRQKTRRAIGKPSIIFCEAFKC